MADIPHRQILVHTQPQAAHHLGAGRYGERSAVRPGEAICLRLDEMDLEPIRYEEVMR
ncbi:MAG: hypothetical protein IRY99_00130 [Isosphaeraceae bacterium]|nr:hypothetical protein [Isosphaeraceae bacterium]